MKLLQRILVAVDLGPRTESVIDTAACLAKAFGSEIYLLHVLPDLDTSSSEARDVLNTARQGAAGRLAAIRARLEQEGVPVAEETVAVGSPFDEIIRYGDDIEANVLVVGSRNETPPSGLRLGTTAERLCRKAGKPVWIVEPESRLPPRSILCAADGSAPSRRALRNAIHLARRFDAHLSVLHVIRPMSALPGLTPAVERGMEAKHVEAETARFEAFLREFDLHGVRWEKRIREGMPAEAIVETASAIEADVLVMGSVGRTGLSRILLGSVAGKVARALPCSTITVKSEDAIRLRIDEELSDLKTHYRRGWELLDEGFPHEARRQFEHCVRTSDMFAPAWAGMAEACQRLGEAERARECRETADRIEEALAWRRVEADIRRGHPLWKKD